MAEPEQDPSAPRRVGRRWVMAGFVVLIVVVAGYVGLGTPGVGDRSPDKAGKDGAGMALGVAEFEQRMARPDAFVINVHVPDEGSIAGTDAAIPYDRIVGDDRLPADRSTPILLYCKTGRMSAEAAVALIDAGYRDVVQLDGGMEAWQATGRRLIES